MIKRRETKTVRCGTLAIGGHAPISIQSMTNTKTDDFEATLRQIKRLEQAGCEIVRLAVPDMASAKSIGELKKHVDLPLVADVHFDHELAIEAVKRGADKLRINPGNIVRQESLERIALICRQRGVPIRIGVNAGSLSKKARAKYGEDTSEAMVYSALEYAGLFEGWGCEDLVISMKSSDVLTTVDAFRKLAQKTQHPFHVGITEAGTFFKGCVKSSIGIGSLLMDGIGDTLRVSITGDPVQEVRIAKEILDALRIRAFGCRIVSCPTCGRTTVDLEKLVNEVESALEREGLDHKHLTIAVMGCEVNGPGEAKDADIGIAASKGRIHFFKDGRIIGSSVPEKAVELLMNEIRRM